KRVNAAHPSGTPLCGIGAGIHDHVVVPRSILRPATMCRRKFYERCSDPFRKFLTGFKKYIILPFPCRRSLACISYCGSYTQYGVFPFVSLYSNPNQEKLIFHHKQNRVAIRQVRRIRQFKWLAPLPTSLVFAGPHDPHIVCRTLSTSLKPRQQDRKSTRLNSSHVKISYAVFCLNKNLNSYYTCLQ